MSQNLPWRSLQDFLLYVSPNHLLLAGANNRNVIITQRFILPQFKLFNLVCPLKFCITIVFNFSWDYSNTQEKLETIVLQNWGVNKVHHGLCENDE